MHQTGVKISSQQLFWPPAPLVKPKSSKIQFLWFITRQLRQLATQWHILSIKWSRRCRRWLFILEHSPLWTAGTILGHLAGLIVKYTILHSPTSAKRYIAQITAFSSLVIIPALMAVYEIPNEVSGVFYVSFEFALSSPYLLLESSGEAREMLYAYKARTWRSTSWLVGNRLRTVFVNEN